MVRRAIPLVVTLALAAPALAQDPVKVAPANHKVELENDHVRVLRIVFEPGEQAPVHQHPASAGVMLSDEMTPVLTEQGQPAPTLPTKRGGVVLTEPTKHRIEHTGTRRSEVVLVEFKSPAPPRTLTPDAVKADPKHYTVEAENDHFRVIRVRYAPGEKSVLHQHYPAVAIFMSDASARFADAAGKTDEQQMTAGQVVWDPGDSHIPENTGKQPLEVVLIEIKPAR